MIRSLSSSILATAIVVAGVAGQDIARPGEHVEGERRCFTLPVGLRFTGPSVPIMVPSPGGGPLVPTGGLVAVVSGTFPDNSSTPDQPGEMAGLIAIDRGPDGSFGHVRWTRELGTAFTEVRLAGGWDMTGDGEPDVLVTVSPRASVLPREPRFAAGKLMLASWTDGSLHDALTVPSDGLLLGSSITTVEPAKGSPIRFLIEATNLYGEGDASGKVFDFVVGRGSLATVLSDTDVGGSLSLGIASLDFNTQGAESATSVVVVQVEERDPDQFSVSRYRTVAVDLGTHKLKTLRVCIETPAPFACAAAQGTRSTENVILAEVCDDFRTNDAFLQLRQVSARTAKVIETRRYEIHSGPPPNGYVDAFWCAAGVTTTTDIDHDGTQDYICSSTCFDPLCTRLLLISGAKGTVMGQIDNDLLQRLLGPTWKLHLAPWLVVPLGDLGQPDAELGVGCRGEDWASISSLAIIRLSDCLLPR